MSEQTTTVGSPPVDVFEASRFGMVEAAHWHALVGEGVPEDAATEMTKGWAEVHVWHAYNNNDDEGGGEDGSETDGG